MNNLNFSFTSLQTFILTKNGYLPKKIDMHFILKLNPLSSTKSHSTWEWQTGHWGLSHWKTATFKSNKRSIYSEPCKYLFIILLFAESNCCWILFPRLTFKGTPYSKSFLILWLNEVSYKGNDQPWNWQ